MYFFASMHGRFSTNSLKSGNSRLGMKAAYIVATTGGAIMKKQMSQKGMYVGAGAGIVLFALIGLLPGSFMGGAVGLSIATHIFGGPLGTSLLPRIIVGAAMVFGVLLSGLLFLVGASSVGWLVGYIIDAARRDKTVEKESAIGEDGREKIKI
jgi:ribosomal protein L27